MHFPMDRYFRGRGELSPEVPLVEVEDRVYLTYRKARYLERQSFRGGKQTIHVVVSQLPKRAGIDPYNTLIDRQGGDNVRRLRSAEPRRVDRGLE